jgi:hypothetical protein
MLILFTAALIAAPIFTWKAAASGSISGSVYIDYNANGIKDTTSTVANNGAGSVRVAVDGGAGGVEVRAFDSTGANVTTTGFVTTLANGNFSLSASGTGPYRIEFSNLPAGYSPSAIGANNASTVRFVPDGTSTNVDLGITSNFQYSQDAPELYTACYSFGAANGANANDPVLISLPYTAGAPNGSTNAQLDNPTTHTTMLTHSQVGTTFGIAYRRSSNRLYASAYFKKHSGFGPGADGTLNNADDSGTVYVVNPATNSVVDDFVIPGTTNQHNTANYDTDNGNTGWDAVGKRSLGSIDISDDESSLYVMNLENRSLYKVALPAHTVGSPVSMVPSPLPPSCSNNSDVRPFAVQFHNDQLYIGLVCSAQVSGSAANLRAYVYTADPNTMALSASPVVNFPLNYPRGRLGDYSTIGQINAAWRAWSATFQSLSGVNGDETGWPQPMLTDIEFDVAGNMYVGLRDRGGDQYGVAALDNPGDTDLYTGNSGGDLIKACGNPTSGWTVESNGICSGVNGSGVGNNQGLITGSSGEFFARDEFRDLSNLGHDEITIGGMMQLPGYPDLMVNAYDPINVIAGQPDDGSYSGGMRWYNMANGSWSKAYRLYRTTATGDTFAKSNGLGDLAARRNLAPIQLGNRVWMDSDADGVQDPNEMALANVTVRLYNSANTLVGTAVTDANGNYLFVSSTVPDSNTGDSIGQVNGGIQYSSAYQIRFDVAANYASGGALFNKVLTAANSTFQDGLDDSNDSDAGLVSNPTGSPAGNWPVIALTTGGAGENNHTFDVGFAGVSTYSVGNRVWYDTNDNGRIDAGEEGVNGVSVSIFADSDTNGVPDTPGSPIGTMNTSGGGYYRFDSLAAGSYVIRVNPSNFTGVLEKYRNTSGNVTSDTDSTSTSAGENGINAGGPENGVLTNGVLSNTITLGPGTSEPTGETDMGAGDGAMPDSFTDLTVDFGFYELCVCGTLWMDTGGGADTDDGILDASETGRVPNVMVQLYDGAGNEILTGPDGYLGTADDGPGGVITNSSGGYCFHGITGGDYQVVVMQGTRISSTPPSNDPDDNVDNDDNGVAGSGAFVNKIVSGIITLVPGGEPLVNNADGTSANVTVDFGFIGASLAVKMSDMKAEMTKRGVGLTFLAGEEVNNLGYRVWREFNGEKQLVNRELIAGSALLVGPDTTMYAGKDYRVLDTQVDAAMSESVVYWIEALDLNGSSEWFGPVAVEGKNSARDFTPMAPTLGDFNRAVASRDGQTDMPEGMTPAKSALDKKVKSNGLHTDLNPPAGNDRALKIFVKKDGLQKVSAQTLAENGFNFASASNWQLFTDGRQQPINVNQDNSFEFYGRGIEDPYSDSRVYWLVEANSPGTRFSFAKPRHGAGRTSTWSRIVAERRDRLVRSTSVLNGERENWYAGVIFTQPNTQSIYVSDVAAESNETATIGIDLQGMSNAAHRVQVSLNGSTVGEIQFASMERREWQAQIPLSLLQAGANSIQLVSLAGSSDVSLLEAVRISYPRKHRAENDRLMIRTPSNTTTSFGGFTSPDIFVYDVTNPEAITVMEFEGQLDADGTYSFVYGKTAANRVLLLQGSQTAPDNIIHTVRNSASDLGNVNNSAKFIIIAPERFAKALEPLQAKRKSEGLPTMIVDIEDIYDEFSYGTKGINAIKAFLRYAKTNWTGKPDYVLLVGDASSDPKNYTGNGGANADVIPTAWVDTALMEASSDEALVDLNGDMVGEMAIGRLPVRTAAELQVVLGKILNTEPVSSDVANQRGALMVADLPIGYDFIVGNQNIRTRLPAAMQVTAVNRADGEAAVVRQALINRVNAGPLLVNFFGHGTSGMWTGAGILRYFDAANLTNANNLSVITMLTCLNGSFAEQNETISETVFKTSTGGSFAVWTASAMNFADVQEQMSYVWYRDLMNGLRMGDAAKNAKLSLVHQDTRATYIILGDPTQRVVIP